MRLSTVAHHILPFAAVAGGILVLLMPRLLNYVVAIYLILVGAHWAQQHLSLHSLIALHAQARADAGAEPRRRWLRTPAGT